MYVNTYMHIYIYIHIYVYVHAFYVHTHAYAHMYVKLRIDKNKHHSISIHIKTWYMAPQLWPPRAGHGSAPGATQSVSMSDPGLIRPNLRQAGRLCLYLYEGPHGLCIAF